MRIYFYFFLLVLLFTSLHPQFLIAQSDDDQSKIWSVVKIDQNNLNQTKLKEPWIPADQIPKFYEMGGGIIVGPNFRPKPTTNSTQSELSIDIHPTNQNILFAGANATDWPVTNVYGTGVYWSLNGGTTWTGFDNPPFGENSGDPASVIGADGRFYENYISNPGGQGVSVSTNNGTNWTNHTIAPNPGSLADKNHYMVDKKSTSPFLHRSYCAWTDFGGANDGDVVLRFSTNFGVNWSASSINLSNSLTSALNQGVNIQTGPNGEVYATWAVYIDGSVTTGEDGIGFSKSTNGGATWSAPTYAYQSTNFGIRGTFTHKNGVRVSSFPSMSVDKSGGPYNGYIYITWPQDDVSPAGSDPDIVLIRSTNGGTSWSSPIRINNDALNNGKDQYFPWSTVDQSTGQLMLVFYDSRDVPNNQTEVYMARSLDGGITFENFEVSDQAHTPSPIAGLAGGYAGDYIGVASLNNNAFPYWADNRTGNYQGWMAKVNFGAPCPVNPPSNPNPLNGANNTSVNLPQLTWTNGSGATKCEVWFGGVGSMVKVYDGVLISSYNISGPLNYNATYNWQIIDKNDTCGVAGNIWAFTTESSPDVIFVENFNNLSCWTAIGPLGTTNWSTQNTANAGGASPELRLNWEPQFNGLSKLRSCAISVQTDHDYTVDLTHMLDWWANPAPTMGIGVSYDNGATYTPIWSFTPTGNVGPQPITASFTTPVSDSPEAINLNLVLFQNGNSFNIDFWYVDNIVLTDDEFFSTTNPTNVSATPINSSQINVAFTPNISNNNVIVVWNLTGIFTTPSGPPPTPGNPFAGGTLLSNGTTSPVQHMGLNPLTTYYYKLFSYNGSTYSTGVAVSAQTIFSFDFEPELFVADDCSNSILLKFGTTSTGTDCFDLGIDVSAPPPPPAGAFDGRFLTCSEALFTDIRETNLNGERIWDIHFRPADGCYPVTFSWDPSELPASGYFHLVDPAFGTLVNVNMRTTNSYTDVLDLRYLQIKFNYEICSNYNMAAGWNLLSLPVDVVNNNYLSLFPNAVPGTLYGYSNGYFTLSTVSNCTGYWLKFPSAQFVEVCGLDRIDCVENLTSGWNLIGGPNCNVPLNNVLDPGGIIVPGTFYGYNGGYFNPNSVDGTKAYWIKTTSVGSITISCDEVTAQPGNNLIISPETFADFGTIEIKDASENNQTLYFDGTLDENISIESFSMPPIPPAGSFDARFLGDYKLSESSEVTIKLQSSGYPISITINGSRIDVGNNFVLQEIANGVQVRTNIIQAGTEILITDANVTLLKITRQQALPTVYNLEQNYPNPFNPSTTIKFSLPEAAHVSLIIYNALGQKVTELINTNLEAGWYNHEWNAGSIASGIYIYVLRTDNFVSTKKMILMK